jgi:hypothetical protein
MLFLIARFNGITKNVAIAFFLGHPVDVGKKSDSDFSSCR